MPELAEQMYCHEQICIPPTFPYLLRQYAKAAIRSQPIDLLKWSTAYFRCLSLNIPPPVKPRLEYPIPRDYIGITPGWLRALNYQLQNNATVPFKILWDRWIGSCLQHDTLIKILCLGGFTDPSAIPWNRFIGLCAGHLTDNLTQTMILVCEILTEEPEGGSAMVCLETFLDVYKFLAAIDASKPQTLLNLYFTDSLLNLYEKEKKRAAKIASAEDMGSSETSTLSIEQMLEEEEPEVHELGEGSIVSCPDIASDDALIEPDLEERDRSEESALETRDDDDDEDDDQYQEQDDVEQDDDAKLEEKVEDDEAPLEERKSGEEDVPQEEGDEGVEKDDEEKDDEQKDEDDKGDEQGDKDQKEEGEDEAKDAEKVEDEEEKPADKKRNTDDDLKQVARDIFEKGGIELDEDQVDQPSNVGEEESEDLESYGLLKGQLPSMAEVPGEGGFYPGVDELEQHIKIKYQDAATDHEIAQEDLGEEEEEEEEGAEEIEVDAIPGIGPIVPLELVEAVERYLRNMAIEEHGMTMPRHIRHYNCPPLEVFE